MAVAAGSRKPALMRACARVALVLMAVSASFGLAACGAIDGLGDAVSRWFDVGKPPGGPQELSNSPSGGGGVHPPELAGDW